MQSSFNQIQCLSHLLVFRHAKDVASAAKGSVELRVERKVKAIQVWSPPYKEGACTSMVKASWDGVHDAHAFDFLLCCALNGHKFRLRSCSSPRWSRPLPGRIATSRRSSRRPTAPMRICLSSA